MNVQTLYHYLVERPDKGTQELYIRETGVRASTIWHDRYISQLHEQWQQDEQEHPGMLLVYRENNPQRDMTFQEIARAVSRVDQVGIPLRNTYQNLHFWREPRR